jgi:hypothetical protein
MRPFAKVKAIIDDRDDRLTLWLIALAIIAGAFLTLVV